MEHCNHYLQMHNYYGSNNEQQKYSTVNTNEYNGFRHNFKRKNKQDINKIYNVYRGYREDRNFCAHEILPCISMLDDLKEIEGNLGTLYSLIGKIYYSQVAEFGRKQYENQFFQAMQNDVKTVINNNQENNSQGLRLLINKY